MLRLKIDVQQSTAGRLKSSYYDGSGFLFRFLFWFYFSFVLVSCFMLYWRRPEERDRAAEDQAYTDKMHQTHAVFTFNTLLVPFSVLFGIVSVLLHLLHLLLLLLLLFSRFSSIQHAQRVRFFHMSKEP